MTNILYVTSCFNKQITSCSIQGCPIGSTNPHGGIIGKYLWLAILRISSSGTSSSSGTPSTYLAAGKWRTISSLAIFLRHFHRLRHGAAAMARFTTWRWETVCINNTKWPPYATIVPRHTQAGRSLNLQAHVHTCTPSSHTFIRLRKTLQHGAPYLPIFLYHLIIPPFMGIALGGRDEAHPLLLLRKDSVTFATSVRLRTRNSSVPNPRISMKFNIWFFSNITAKYQVSVEFGKNNRYFTWRPI